ncbi:hypothetical protein OPKNFCMD_1794 [Methylobacterium crusticola]|uniref:Phage gp6-like head-tail connector protein n=1 Tax=Methylobacterium crusticola TaxID=1697972 RepID=A0ABQ4QUP5_9HYPH|nr:hypothetical protein [Methylobacterium crusticola]GJD49065.1 hypothetical protein OPKNFCMD_1794 [Methylobacterium crusticola]
MSDDERPEKIVAPPIDMTALAEAVQVYLADPTTRANEVGVFTVDIAAAVDAYPAAKRFMAKPDCDPDERRRAVTTALLMILLRDRPLLQ